MTRKIVALSVHNQEEIVFAGLRFFYSILKIANKYISVIDLPLLVFVIGIQNDSKYHFSIALCRNWINGPNIFDG